MNLEKNVTLMWLLISFWLDAILGSKIEHVVKDSCDFQNVDLLFSYISKDRFYIKLKGFKCDITKSDFTFDLDKNDQLMRNKFLNIYRTRGIEKYIYVEMV